MKWRMFLLGFAVSIPLLLGLSAWQSERYTRLDRELKDLESSQNVWLESNKRLIAGLSVLESRDRIERIARDELKLEKKAPESVLQIKVKKGGDVDG